MTYNLFDLADVIRSKNSGPYEITFDIIFKELDMLKKVVAKKVFNTKDFASLYKISENDVLNIMAFEPAKAIKITIARPICSGDLGETDVYGAQQHAPLLNFSFQME